MWTQVLSNKPGLYVLMNEQMLKGHIGTHSYKNIPVIEFLSYCYITRIRFTYNLLLFNIFKSMLLFFPPIHILQFQTPEIW